LGGIVATKRDDRPILARSCGESRNRQHRSLGGARNSNRASADLLFMSVPRPGSFLAALSGSHFGLFTIGAALTLWQPFALHEPSFQSHWYVAQHGYGRRWLTVDDLRKSLSAPGDSITIALLGVAVAAVLIAGGAAEGLRVPSSRWRQGHVARDLSIVLEDGTRLPAPDGSESFPPGTAVIVTCDPDQAESYRKTPAAIRVIAGTLDDQRRVPQIREAGCAACALAVASIAAAPLLSAIVAGIGV
jgi:hypothetical protein